MKLYYRKLHSVAELKAEKRKLLPLHEATDKEEWFSASDVNGKKDKKHKAGHHDEETQDSDGFDILSIISNVAGTGIGWETLVNIGLPYLSKAAPKIKSTLFKLTKEVLFGYAKWKGVEIGFRLLKNLLHKKNHSAPADKRKK
jgi:hypothetical protein